MHRVRPDEIVIDRASSKAGHYVLGETVHVVSQLGSQAYRLAGVATYGGADNAAGAQVVAFTPDTASKVIGTPGRYNAIQVVAQPGFSQAQVAANVRAALHDPNTEVITGAQATIEARKATETSLAFVNMFLMTFAIVALIVGSFVIYNTFSITVAQRTKETALLRAIGAKRKQVMRSIRLEALFTGLFASAIGVVAGIATAQGLRLVLKAFGLDLPNGSAVIAPRTIIVSMVVGVVVTLVAAWLPARKASKVAPIEALRDTALDTSAHSKRRVVFGTLVTAAGAFFMAQGIAGAGAGAAGLGALAMFFGVALLGPVDCPPVRTHRRLAAPARAGHGRHAGPGERDAEPASHLGHGLGVDDRRRPGGVHHRVRGVGEDVDRNIGRPGHEERLDRHDPVRHGRAEPDRDATHRRPARDGCGHRAAVLRPAGRRQGEDGAPRSTRRTSRPAPSWTYVPVTSRSWVRTTSPSTSTKPRPRTCTSVTRSRCSSRRPATSS